MTEDWGRTDGRVILHDGDSGKASSPPAHFPRSGHRVGQPGRCWVGSGPWQAQASRPPPRAEIFFPQVLHGPTRNRNRPTRDMMAVPTSHSQSQLAVRRPAFLPVFRCLACAPCSLKRLQGSEAAARRRRRSSGQRGRTRKVAGLPPPEARPLPQLLLFATLPLRAGGFELPSATHE